VLSWRPLDCEAVVEQTHPAGLMRGAFFFCCLFLGSQPTPHTVAPTTFMPKLTHTHTSVVPCQPAVACMKTPSDS